MVFGGGGGVLGRVSTKYEVFHCLVLVPAYPYNSEMRLSITLWGESCGLVLVLRDDYLFSARDGLDDQCIVGGRLVCII
jgi:hypothetical protein